MKSVYSIWISIIAVVIGAFLGYRLATTAQERIDNRNRFVNFFVSTAAAVKNYARGLFSVKPVTVAG